MSGSIQMGDNGLYGASEVITNHLETNNIYSRSGDPIIIGTNLDANNTTSITNLPAPTNGGDAANKTYVDTQISDLHYQGFIQTSDWSFVDGVYEYIVSTPLRNTYYQIQCMDYNTGEVLEFYVTQIDTDVKVRSNILPVNAIIVKVNI